MKKILIAMLAACCVWAAWDATRPTEKYVVKATAGEGDTIWHLVGDTMQREGDHRDIREVIFYTKKISNLTGDLQVGDVVLIPIEVQR
nr:MAG TPA: Ail/Lom protein [Caudoviricetes sp.]